jgi:hypothetical protein
MFHLNNILQLSWADMASVERDESHQKAIKSG